STFPGQVLECGEMDELAIETEDGADLRVAKPERAGSDGVEDWLRIRPRSADDAEDLRRRRLLLAQIRELALRRARAGGLARRRFCFRPRFGCVGARRH